MWTYELHREQDSYRKNQKLKFQAGLGHWFKNDEVCILLDCFLEREEALV